MRLHIRARLMASFSAIALAVSLAAAQQPAPTTNVLEAPLSQTVPVDPLITVGNLPNGLRYYVRRNAQPQGRADARCWAGGSTSGSTDRPRSPCAARFSER